MVYRFDYDRTPAVPRYEAYRRLSSEINQQRKDVRYAEPARLISGKLVQVYLELCRLCAITGHYPFLRPRLESVCVSHRVMPGHLDLEAWRMTVLELAICDQEGRLCLAVVNGKSPAAIAQAFNELGIQYCTLTGIQPPPTEAQRLLETAEKSKTLFRWSISPPQLNAMRHIAHQLGVGYARDRMLVITYPSKLEHSQKTVSDREFDNAAYEMRSSRWFLSNEVPLKTLIVKTGKVGNALVAEYFKTASIDAVVYLTTPFVEPALAIEWDGAHVHSSERSRARDELKEALLSQIDLPLIRIRGTDWRKLATVKETGEMFTESDNHLESLGILVRSFVEALWKMRMRNKYDADNTPYPTELVDHLGWDPREVLVMEMKKYGIPEKRLLKFWVSEEENGFRCAKAEVKTPDGFEMIIESYGVRCSSAVLSQAFMDRINLIASAPAIAKAFIDLHDY